MLAGRVAVITGGSRGIGRATALALAQAGACVAVNYVHQEQAARAVVDAITAAGGEGLCLQADVAVTDEATRLVSEVITHFGRIDILVNNAGITRDGLLLRMKEEDWDAVLDTNLKGAFNCTRAVVRPMLKQKAGRIINIASVVGITGNPGQANYCAAKAGLIGFTKAVARELAPRGVLVNAVAPGFIETEMTAQLPDATRAALQSQIPLGQVGQPEDVAAAVCFLASDAARYITGQVLVVDGGLAM